METASASLRGGGGTPPIALTTGARGQRDGEVTTATPYRCGRLYQYVDSTNMETVGSGVLTYSSDLKGLKAMAAQI